MNKNKYIERILVNMDFNNSIIKEEIFCIACPVFYEKIKCFDNSTKHEIVDLFSISSKVLKESNFFYFTTFEDYSFVLVNDKGLGFIVSDIDYLKVINSIKNDENSEYDEKYIFAFDVAKYLFKLIQETINEDGELDEN